jgi:hypothetical protein
MFKCTKSTTKILSSITFSFLLLFPSISSAALIAAFQNGGFEGYVGDTNSFNEGTPPGWTTTDGSPDVFNENTTFVDFAWNSSSTGGDFLHGIGWDGMASGSYTESALQVGLGGLVIGQQYEISFEQTISNSEWSTGDGYWEIIFGTESHVSELMTIPDLGVAANWGWQTFMFTATSTIQTLEVIAHGVQDLRADLGIDSFFLGDPGTNPNNPSTSIPEPFTLTLFGLGILGVLINRKTQH